MFVELTVNGNVKIRLGDGMFSDFIISLFFDHWAEQEYKELCPYREEDI